MAKSDPSPKKKKKSQGDLAPKKKKIIKKKIIRKVRKKKTPEKKATPKLKPEKEDKYQAISDREHEDNIVRYHELHDKLKNKLEKLYKSSGITHKKVQEYLDSPDNFEPNEWTSVQRHRKTITENLMRQIDPNYKGSRKRKRSQKAHRKLRGKAMGKRKKWLNMD